MDEIPKDPIEKFSDESIEADVILSDLQRQALTNLIGDSKRSVGLADLGQGYVKIIFYGVEGDVEHTELLHAHFGDAVMPEFKNWD